MSYYDRYRCPECNKIYDGEKCKNCGYDPDHYELRFRAFEDYEKRCINQNNVKDMLDLKKMPIWCGICGKWIYKLKHKHKKK